MKLDQDPWLRLHKDQCYKSNWDKSLNGTDHTWWTHKFRSFLDNHENYWLVKSNCLRKLVEFLSLCDPLEPCQLWYEESWPALAKEPGLGLPRCICNSCTAQLLCTETEKEHNMYPVWNLWHWYESGLKLAPAAEGWHPLASKQSGHLWGSWDCKATRKIYIRQERCWHHLQSSSNITMKWISAEQTILKAEELEKNWSS